MILISQLTSLLFVPPQYLRTSAAAESSRDLFQTTERENALATLKTWSHGWTLEKAVKQKTLYLVEGIPKHGNF